MLANRPGSSTRQGRLIFSAPATSPSSGRSAVSLHTRTKLRQFNSWSAVDQPYLQNLSHNFRGVFRSRGADEFWPHPSSPKSQGIPAARNLNNGRSADSSLSPALVRVPIAFNIPFSSL